jgi:hypothetical protein
MSGSELIQLQNGLYIEVQAPPDDQPRQISASQAKRVQAAMDEVRGLLLKAVEPVAAVWDEMNRDLQIDNVEIELGLGFEAKGNLFIAQGSGNANIRFKLTVKPKPEG